MSSRRLKLLARINWYLQSSSKHIIECITGNAFYFRGGRYRQVSLYIIFPHWGGTLMAVLMEEQRRFFFKANTIAADDLRTRSQDFASHDIDQFTRNNSPIAVKGPEYILKILKYIIPCTVIILCKATAQRDFTVCRNSKTACLLSVTAFM